MVNENTTSKKENHNINFTNPEYTDQKYAGQKYAGFWIRLAASLIDFVVTLPILVAIIYILGADEYISQSYYSNSYNTEYYTNYTQYYTKTTALADIISWVIIITYSVFFLSSKMQATPGKMICSIYVATKDNRKLTILRAAARFFCSILSALIFGIGFFMIAFTKEKTALHDLICSTRVFYKNHF